MSTLFVTKADGTSEAFIEEKLERSLKRAGAKAEVAEKITDDIVMSASNGVSTQEIYRKAFARLKREYRPVAARYSLRRALLDLGPTGFPFEDFVGELFKAEGYETQTRVTARGQCSDHELDVVATNGGECIALELKFHNDPGYRTDTRVALYVHARMNDIFNQRDKDVALCPVNRGMLVTNTKFTNNAISYAACVGMEMLGWEYPENNSLLDRMTRLHIYPITALTTLSKSQKRVLIEQGIILCATLAEHKEALLSVGLSKTKIEQVIKEANGLCTMPEELAKL